jgi:hypothetical protein
MIDVGKLTAEESQNLFRELFNVLTEESVFEVLNELLTEEQKEALVESWSA